MSSTRTLPKLPTLAHLLNTHYLVTKGVRVDHANQADEQVKWPNERSLSDIENLYMLPFGEILATCHSNDALLDIGPGKGKFIADVAAQFKHKQLRCYGIATTIVDDANIGYAKEIAYCAVPESKNWLERRAGFYKYAFDTYAALTYSPNAIHSLVYILLAMAPGGKFFSMSSLSPGNTENSRFGNTSKREELIHFFKKMFNVNLRFDLIKIESKACKPGTYMDDLRVSFEVPSTGLKLPAELARLTTWALFKQLCHEVDNVLGIPVKLDASVSFKAGKYEIAMYDFINVANTPRAVI